MKINGAYKFRTKAYKDNFRACFLKLSFFEGSTQISKDEFAQSITGGVVETFLELFSYNYYPLSSFNLSARVQAEILVSDNKGRFLFQRVINNLLDYSFFNVIEGDVPPDGAGHIQNRHRQLILPDVTPVLDIENDEFSVSTIIAPQGTYVDYTYHGDYRRPMSYRNAKISGVEISGGIDMLDIYSFKNNEPIETILLKSKLKVFGSVADPSTQYIGFETGTTLLSSELYYRGGGLWANEVYSYGDENFFSYSNNSFIHKYPNTEILPSSGLPASHRYTTDGAALVTAQYNIDFGKSYSSTYDAQTGGVYVDLCQNYHSVIKDSKTGDLIVLEEYLYSNRRPFVDPPVWRLLYNDTPATDFFNWYSDSQQENVGKYLPEEFTIFNGSKIGFFLYDGDFVGMDGSQVRGGKLEVTIKTNQEYPLIFGEREATENSLSVDLPEDFKKALEDSESGDKNILLHQGKEVYSETTKSCWRFCNAIVLER